MEHLFEEGLGDAGAPRACGGSGDGDGSTGEPFVSFSSCEPVDHVLDNTWYRLVVLGCGDEEPVGCRQLLAQPEDSRWILGSVF